MIVLTTACRAILSDPHAASAWPGPFCLVQLPGDPVPPGIVADWLFDTRPAPPSALALMREVLLKIAALGEAAPGPVLLLDADRPAADLGRLHATARADPRIVHRETDDEGRTRLLLFGAEVAAHRLFLTHFRNMIDDIPEEHTEASLRIARTYLAGGGS